MNRWLIQILICVIALTMVFSIGFAQKVVTIPQLQQVSLDSLKKLDSLQGLAAGASIDKSPYWHGANANADTVSITGVVVVRPGILTYTLGRYNIYVQDTTTGAVWAGLNVLTNDTSAGAQAGGITALDTGMVVTITGRVLEYGGNNSLTEMYHWSVSAPIYTSPPLISIGNIIARPAAREIPLSALAAGNLPHPSTGEQYESMYVVVRNITVTSVDYTSGTFSFQDSLGNIGYIYDGSGWYTLRGHKITGSRYTPPPVGTKLSYIRGVVVPLSRSGTCGDYRIMPMYPGPREQTNSKYAGDIGIAQFSPQITNIVRTPSPPKRTDAVKVTWVAKNLNTGGKIDSSFFNWKLGSSTTTNWTRSKATATSGDSLYSATIPAANADTLVSYFVEAYGGGVYGAAPDPSKPAFYQIRQSGLIVKDVQYTPYAGGLSGMLGDTVTVSGVITADSTDIKQSPYQQSGRPTLWMASAAGAWNGIAMYGANAGVGLDTLVRGDSVQVTGVVTELGVASNDSRTSLLVRSVTLVKRGVRMPAATTIAMSGSGSVSYQDANRPIKGASPFEQWESVLITTPTVYVNMANADVAASYNFGELFISTTKGATTLAYGIRVNDDGTNNYYADTAAYYQTSWRSGHPISPPKTKLIPVAAAIASLTGIMTYSNGEYKLEPRKNDDFGLITGVTYQVEGVVPKMFELSQNYPNPFNPSTTIRYSLPVGGKVTLRVFNLLGQVVETLVDQQQNTGSYVVVFNASRLSSGAYFYKLETDQYSLSKKMLLLK